MNTHTNIRTFFTSGVVAGTIVASAATAPAGAAARTFDCATTKACVGGANAGAGIGLSGTSKSTYGVFGVSAVSAGVFGLSHSGGSVGIYGTNDAGGTGISASANGLNPALAIAQAGYGLGIGLNTVGTGINGTSTQGDGIDMEDGGTNSNAVVGVDASGGGSGIGIWGLSQNGSAGVFANAGGNGKGALEVFGGTTNNGYALAEFHDNNGYTRQSFDDSGNLYLSGQLFTTGSCQYGCSKTRGVLTYTPRTAEPTLSDDGEARLANGETRVQLDPSFANVMDERHTYLVTVTPEGPTHGLYVAQRDAHGFVVRENPPAASSATFTYHIVARPYGVQSRRLPSVAIARQTIKAAPAFRAGRAARR
jgi:hypothetical protein